MVGFQEQREIEINEFPKNILNVTRVSRVEFAAAFGASAVVLPQQPNFCDRLLIMYNVIRLTDVYTNFLLYL